MKVTVYLPDSVYERAKEAGDLNLSRMLRDAVEAELDRREPVVRELEGASR